MAGIKFECRHGKETSTVMEESGRVVGTYRHEATAEATAEAHAKFLNKEHARGRVAQGICSKGEPCDRDRIHLPEMLTDLQRASLILCAEHSQVAPPL